MVQQYIIELKNGKTYTIVGTWLTAWLTITTAEGGMFRCNENEVVTIISSPLENGSSEDETD